MIAAGRLDQLHDYPSCFVPRQARDEEAQHEDPFFVASRNKMNLILSLSKDEAAALEELS
jgi:hypothetical protein